ncbi:hypothetical protein [Flavobacterium lindanitolerans]|jgi:hypothetical protein|uniref:hypothetical protein n=1 Tax=Flavobacterium lindanitolerans TaxID=428988 RepID=UPI0027B9A94F|nr:hypothetical protein [Flavobacterium lindanitolerans]
MKKSILIVGIIALFAFASCREDKKVPEPAPKTPPVDNPTPPPSPTTVAPTSNDDGTNISVSKDGAAVETKDGKNKTGISVSKNDASVEIKKSKN